MPCGPQMVGRTPAAGARGDAAAPGFTARKPCLGPGHVEPSESDDRRVRSLLAWSAWAAVAVGIAVAIVASIATLL